MLLTLSGSLGSWHGSDDHDADSRLLVHDHSAHHESVGPSGRVADQSHCAFCHWLKTVTTGAPGETHTAPSHPLVLVRRSTLAHVRMSDRLDLPPRAPPRA